MTVASADEVTAVLGFAVDIDEVDITTDIHSDTNIQRTFEFHLSSDAVNLIGSSIEDRLNTAAGAMAGPDDCQYRKCTEQYELQYCPFSRIGG